MAGGNISPPVLGGRYTQSVSSQTPYPIDANHVACMYLYYYMTGATLRAYILRDMISLRTQT